MLDFLYQIDFAILDFIRDNLSCGALDWLMPKITLLGNIGFIWIVTAVVLLAIKKYRKTGAMLAIGLICCVIITNLILKNDVARDRPCWINDAVQLIVANPLDFSFPSGHTASSITAAEILRRSNKFWGIGAYVIAVLIAFSRLYLYVHFPSDVLIGAIIGLAIGTAVSLVCKNKLKLLEPKLSDQKTK